MGRANRWYHPHCRPANSDLPGSCSSLLRVRASHEFSRGQDAINTLRSAKQASFHLAEGAFARLAGLLASFSFVSLR